MIFDRTRPANDAEPLAFGCAEHLVLWACRRSADWRQSHDDLAPELLDACGAGAMEIMGALDLFASCLCAARGGFPRLQPCGSLDVSEDELRLLRLVSACQHGRFDHAQQLLQGVVGAEHGAELLLATSALAEALMAGGLEIGLRPLTVGVCPQKALAPGHTIASGASPSRE